MQPFLLAALAGAAAAIDPAWSYIKRGEGWPGQCSSGKYQSPVDFVKIKELNRGFLEANLTGWVNTDNLSFYMPADVNDEQNRNGSPTLGDQNGPKGAFPGNQKLTKSFVQMTTDKNASAQDTKGNKVDASWSLDTYVATKGVFHTPSEHTVDGVKQAVEFQIYFDPWTSNPLVKKPKVTVNPGKEKATSKVANPEKGSMNYIKPQAAVGIFFKVLDCNKEVGSKKVAACDAAMKPSNDLFKALGVYDDKIKKAWAYTKGSDFTANALEVPLQNFMAAVQQKNFYQYYGSETTWPCAEGVNWAVYSDPLPISPKAWKVFNDRVVMKMSYSRKKGNSRATQPMGKRLFYFNDLGNKMQGSGATRLVASAALGVAMIMAV